MPQNKALFVFKTVALRITVYRNRPGYIIKKLAFQPCGFRLSLDEKYQTNQCLVGGSSRLKLKEACHIYVCT